MLNNGGTKYAQVGWIEYFSDQRNTFVQYTAPQLPSYMTYWYPPQAEDTFTQYRVEYWGNFNYYVGSMGLGYSPNYFTPNQGQISGEITNLQSQMPGDTSSPDVFQLSYIYTSGWIPFDGVTTVTPGFAGEFGAIEVSPYQAWIWDWECDS